MLNIFRKYFIIIVLIFVSSKADLLSFESSNKVLIDSLINTYADGLTNKMISKDIKSSFIVFNSRENEYFQDLLINNILKKNIQIFNKENVNTIKIYFPLIEANISYSTTKNNLNIRNIDLKIITNQIDKNGEITSFFENSFSIQDTLSSSDYSQYEDTNLPFTKGKRPEKQKNLFDEILEPAIVITASIVSVVLFFSVRSK